MDSPMEILTKFPVRKSRKQKQAFRSETIAWLQRQGYRVSTESGLFGGRNLVAGDPETAKYLITAHYDTCAWLPIANMAFPCSFWMTFLWQAILLLAIYAFPTALALIFYAAAKNVSAALLLWGFTVLLELTLMLLGPANRHCANDNTSGVITALEIAGSMPEEARGQVCFVLFDLEEFGLWGSLSYRRAHKKAAETQMVLNLDCVGDGNHIVMLPSKSLRKDPDALEQLSRCGGWYGKKRIFVRKKGFFSYASDQKNFPRGVGICALRRRGKLLYLGRIHTQRDTVCDITNVNLLRAAIVSMIAVRQ